MAAHSMPPGLDPVPRHGHHLVVNDLVENSAAELARMVRDGTVSAAEVVEAHLARIEEENQSLGAIVTLRADGARSDADAVQRRLRDELDLPLAGVPFTVKDLIATGGVRTTAGTRLLADFVPKMDATAVARLRAAGAVLMGKTNCPEFGMFPYTDNALFGETRNPLGPVTPGGSSGGESAAIAGRLSAVGVGTDFGGSVRWPAHCTGILAIRPTAGRVPGTGMLPAPSLDEPILPNSTTLQGRVQVIGPLTRSAEDLELALRIMSGPDGLDPAVAPVPLRPSSHVDPGRLRVAWWDGPSSPAVCAEGVDSVRAAVRSLEQLGLEVGRKDLGMLDRAITLYGELRDLDRLQDVRRLARGREDELGQDTRAAVEGAIRFSSSSDPALLWEERDRLRAKLVGLLQDYPVLVMPVATLPACDFAGPTPTVNGVPQTMWDILAPSRAISLFGVPAAAIPFGASAEGLPIGVQIVGRPFREDEVLAVARLLSEGVAASPAEGAKAEVP